ncbi:hypothetical protein Tco_0775884 [Tanacetum coccineum]
MWPTEWSSKYPLLNNIVMPHLPNAKDELFWKDLENKEVKFLVSAVWENIRPRSIEVDWFSVVWTHVKSLSGISNIPTGLSNIVDFLIPLANKKSARCVIAKFLFAASCYFIWQEHNERLFSKKKRTCDQIMEIIKTNVHLKLLSCRFKKTNIVQSLCDVWKLPNSLMSPPLRNLDG